MNILTYGAEDLNSAFPKFDEVSGLVTFETSAPLYGRGSVKFDQSQVQYIGKAFPLSNPVTNSWQHFHFKASAIKACGLVQWLTGTSARGDLRFNEASGKLEARVNGELVKRSAKIFYADILYSLQFYLTVNASYQYVQVKIDDKPLLALDYFLNSGASPANYDKFRWGPFLGGGTGILLLDDLFVNDADTQSGGDYSWTGRLTITDEGPIGNGANITNEFGATNAPSVAEATNELDEDEDDTFAHTETNHRRQTVRFNNPSQPVGGILEAVYFDVVTRVTSVPSEEARIKVRFRDEVILDEIQTLRITNGEPGDTIQFGYGEVDLVNSAVLDFDASLEEVQAEADAIFGVGGVTVTGTPGSELIFGFRGHWSQTRMLAMQAGGTFAGSDGGSITVERTQIGQGIYEVGTPFGYLPAGADFPDDIITDAYPEPLTTLYECRTARKRVALDGGAWTKSKADAVQLALRSVLPFTVATDENLPPPGENSAVVNQDGINGFGINAGTGEEGTGIPVEEPPPPPPDPDPAPIEVGGTGNIFWVSKTGSPSNDGLTILTPKQTVAQGLGLLTDGNGDTLYVRGGEYQEYIDRSVASGTSGQHTSIVAYNNEPVILKPNSGNYVLNLEGEASYIVFDGLVFDGVNVLFNVAKITRNSVSSPPAHHITLQRCELKNSPKQCIIITYGSDYCQLLNLTAHNCGKTIDADGLYGYGIYLKASYCLLDGLDVFNMGSSGMQIFSTTAGSEPPINNTVRNSRFHHNTVLSAAQGRGSGVVIAAGVGNMIYNVLSYAQRAGFTVSYNSGAKLFNNDAWGNSVYGFDLREAVWGAQLKNNIAYGNGQNLSHMGSFTDVTNIWDGRNPLFANPGAGDFHLQSGSPAIGQGTSLAEVTFDFDRAPRGNPPDIGALEF